MNRFLLKLGRKVTSFFPFLIFITVFAYSETYLCAQTYNSSQQLIRTIVLHPTDGDPIELLVHDGQKITFDDENIILCLQEGTFSHPLVNLEKWSYDTQIVSSIDTVAQKALFSIANKSLNVKGMEGQTFCVTSISGITLAIQTMTESFSFDLSAINEKIFILKIGNYSFKYKQ